MKTYFNNIFLLLILLALFESGEAYRKVQCVSTDGWNMGCDCAHTEVNVACPANFYCPEYSVHDLEKIENQNALNLAGCTIDHNKVQCPCTPGFYCPANTSQPIYCCPGFYCPSDSGSTPPPDLKPELKAQGLGTWGKLAYQCPKDNFCVNGQVDPFKVPALSTAKAGSDGADKKGTIILLVFIIIFLYIFFEALDYMRKREQKLSNLRY